MNGEDLRLMLCVLVILAGVSICPTVAVCCVVGWIRERRDARQPIGPFVVDLSKPPIPPPNLVMIGGLWSGGETKWSKRQQAAWDEYIEAYGEARRAATA